MSTTCHKRNISPGAHGSTTERTGAPTDGKSLHRAIAATHARLLRQAPSPSLTQIRNRALARAIKSVPTVPPEEWDFFFHE